MKLFWSSVLFGRCLLPAMALDSGWGNGMNALIGLMTDAPRDQGIRLQEICLVKFQRGLTRQTSIFKSPATTSTPSSIHLLSPAKSIVLSHLRGFGRDELAARADGR